MSNRPFVVEKKGERRSFKPKPWGHQQDLAAARGKRISLFFADGTSGDFTLAEADAYTVKVLSLVDGHKSALTYFKHAIVSYKIGV